MVPLQLRWSLSLVLGVAVTLGLMLGLYHMIDRPEEAVIRLHLVAARGRPPEILACLSEGTDVNSTGAYGETALHWAIEGGRSDMVRLLLERGADLNIRDRLGRTPLAWAADAGHQDLQGATPLHWTVASRAGGPSIRTELIQLLLAGGADPEIRDRTGKTPLDLARDQELFLLVDALMKGAP